MIHAHDIDKSKIFGLDQRSTSEGVALTYRCNATAAYGMGERYDGVDRMGKRSVCRVVDHFTNQNDKTYFPIPFFFCNDGHGVFVESDAIVTLTLDNGEVHIEVADDGCDVWFFYGTPKEIISAFAKKTGKPSLPPKWAFGLWVSANRWNKQQDVMQELETIKALDYPATVLVIEAWSDEATFYIWNGAEYALKEGSQRFGAQDFTFREPWHDPQQMIDAIHDAGIKLVLWQIPALKKLDEGQVCPQHDIDDAHAISEGYVVTTADGSPYEISEQWFVGSHLPDFTDPRVREWWMGKRQYLLDMGVDGFKTDGGEFVYDMSSRFYNGRVGRNMRNRYPVEYEQTYADAIGSERVLFSRAGYTGSQATPIHWAGDQVSTFSELRAVLGAGLSLGLSGVPFWSFDIAGFAGKMPSAELYIRATQLAVFVPVMQWHSEPLGGQFGGENSGLVNDRSPWHMAEYTGDSAVQHITLRYANLRMNLMPEIYNQARLSSTSSLPMMRHLVLEYPDDLCAAQCHDEFILGDLLIAPILAEGAVSREVYLPNGRWFSLITHEYLEGGQTLTVAASIEQIPVFLRSPGAIALNLADSMRTGDSVGNDMKQYKNLVIVVSGAADYDFDDGAGVKLRIRGGASVEDASAGSARLVDISKLSLLD